MPSTETTESIDDARRLCSDILGYVQAGQRGDGLYDMVLELALMLDVLCALHAGCSHGLLAPIADLPGDTPWPEARRILAERTGRPGRKKLTVEPADGLLAPEDL